MDEPEKEPTPAPAEPPAPEPKSPTGKQGVVGPKGPEPPPAPAEPPAGLNELINGVKSDYEAKIKQIESDYKTRLNEREGVIRQLLRGEPTNPAPSQLSAIDEINKKRNFKNW